MWKTEYDTWLSVEDRENNKHIFPLREVLRIKFNSQINISQIIMKDGYNIAVTGEITLKDILEQSKDV